MSIHYMDQAAQAEAEIEKNLHLFGPEGPFMVSDERAVKHLKRTLGSSLVASSAYQKWPAWSCHLSHLHLFGPEGSCVPLYVRRPARACEGTPVPHLCPDSRMHMITCVSMCFVMRFTRTHAHTGAHAHAHATPRAHAHAHAHAYAHAHVYTYAYAYAHAHVLLTPSHRQTHRVIVMIDPTAPLHNQ